MKKRAADVSRCHSKEFTAQMDQFWPRSIQRKAWWRARSSRLYETERSRLCKLRLRSLAKRSKQMFADFAKQWNINDSKGLVGTLFRQAAKMQSTTLGRVEQQDERKQRAARSHVGLCLRPPDARFN